MIMDIFNKLNSYFNLVRRLLWYHHYLYGQNFLKWNYHIPKVVLYINKYENLFISILTFVCPENKLNVLLPSMIVYIHIYSQILKFRSLFFKLRIKIKTFPKKGALTLI